MEMTLTKNFWTNVHTLLFGNSNVVGYLESSSNAFAGAYSMYTIGNFKDTSGTTRTQVAGEVGNYAYAYALSLFAFNNSSQYGSYFAVGSGTTAATVDDYAIEQSIANATVNARGQNSADGSVTFHVNVTATDDISVSEICLLKKLTTRTTAGSEFAVLIGRAVLDTPVALASGESKTFDVTISLPMPA